MELSSQSSILKTIVLVNALVKQHNFASCNQICIEETLVCLYFKSNIVTNDDDWSVQSLSGFDWKWQIFFEILKQFLWHLKRPKQSTKVY